jgi:hypothetical protein
MPLGINRSGDSRNGNPVPPLAPSDDSNPVTWPTPNPAHFGNTEPQSDATKNSNPVTWSPSPNHFGNPIS